MFSRRRLSLALTLASALMSCSLPGWAQERFIVVASTKRFDCNGVTYMGISTASPIYKAIDGLQAGDTFTHNDQTFTLQDVM